MFKRLVKFLIPAAGGAGVVCITMHLTNASGYLLNSLRVLNLTEKPDVKEDEIIPKQEPASASETSEENSESEDDSDTEESSQSSDSAEQSSETESQPSVAESSGDSPIVEVIQYYSERIHHQHGYN